MKKITLLLTSLLLGQISLAQDTCATASAITGSGLYTVSVVNGNEPPAQNCTPSTGGAAAHAEWYVYTPTEAHTITLTTDIADNTPRIDTRVHVFVGTCGNLTCYGGDDDSGANYSSVAVFNVAANTTYYIAFDSKWTPLGFKFRFTESEVIIPIPPPVAFVSHTLETAQVGNNRYNNCVVDMNNDYLDDLVGTTGNNVRIHYQKPDGTFTVTNIPTANAENTPYWSIAAGDYNKDGYNDLLYGGSNGMTLMESNATGTAFTKHTPGQYIFCQRTNFVDINNDGNLDAFSCHDVAPNVYYINNAVGGFTYYQSGASGAMNLGITSTGGNYASLWSDYDNDGDVDLFISKCSGPPCELHRNNGDGTFTDISAATHVNITPIQSWSSAVADFDNDGDMDIMVGSNGPTGNILFRNDLGNNKLDLGFTNVSAGSGLEVDSSTSRDYIAYDFDNDGLVDIMGGGYKIFFNQGDMKFKTASYPGMALGAVGDFNNDGFLDIQSVYETENLVKLYMNSGNANNWITINTKGTQSNSNGIAARVEIYGAWGKQIRDVRSGEGFEYMSTLNTHFGIGTATAIDKLVIKWPSGVVDTFNNPPINQSFMAVEGSTLLAAADFANANFSIYPNPANDVLYIKTKNKTTAFKSAEIFDMAGRQVSNTVVTDQPISVKNLSSGSYIILLKDADGKRFTQKFLKK